MSPTRHFGLTAAVAILVAGLIGGTVVLAGERHDRVRPAGDTTRDVAQSLQPAGKAKKKARTPAVRLTASRRTVQAGSRVTFRIRTSTKHPRPVRIQHWDAKRKVWRNVLRRTVRGTTTVSVTPPTGTTRYRAQAPRVRHRAGGKAHAHAAAKSASVTITARARTSAPAPAPTTAPTAKPTPAELSADEKALLAAVSTARATYARPAVTAATDTGAEACLTTYARQHSAWMAGQGSALDPGSAEHRTASRPLPGTACPGHTVATLTRAIGTTTSISDAIAVTVDAWLSSPYGETDRLLSACHDAPAFEYGVAATNLGAIRWLTVLIASDTPATRSSGVC